MTDRTLALVAIATMATAAGLGRTTVQTQSATTSAQAVDDEALRTAERRVAEWLANGRTPGEAQPAHPDKNGGALTTAGDLVFQGTADGRFVAYHAGERREALGHGRGERDHRRADHV
ncbi:MAG: hypothetical protein ACT4QD_21745 [Acidobacteriota bacterium]